MLAAFVLLGVLIVLMFGLLLMNPERFNDRWLDLAAGSWVCSEMYEEEEKLPAGNYVISFPRMEWR